MKKIMIKAIERGSLWIANGNSCSNNLVRKPTFKKPRPSNISYAKMNSHMKKLSADG